MQIAPRSLGSIVLGAMLVCTSAVYPAQSISPAQENPVISVSLNTADGTIAVLDKRTGQRWQQKASARGEITDAITTANGIQAVWHDADLGTKVAVEVQLDADKAEFTLALSAQGDLKRSLRYPHPFITEAGTYLVVPMNEGISYPVDDASVETRTLIAYGGHGICMPFWGGTDGQWGQMAILETPDDAEIRIARIDGKLCIAPEWDAQKGQFGYTRKLRYVFFDKGGHVAMCKRYRSYAKDTGLLKTLMDKRAANPNVDLLMGRSTSGTGRGMPLRWRVR